MSMNKNARNRDWIFTLAAMSVGILGHTPLSGQSAESLSRAVRAYVSVDEPTVALVDVTIVDGRGGPAKPGHTVVITDGRITQVAPTAAITLPANIRQISLTGHTVTPGYVMVHEHMFYPAGNGVYSQLDYSFPRLYLAGGATTIRTGGSMTGYGDINLQRDIASGRMAGPKIDATAPYLEGPGLGIRQVKVLTGPDDARSHVRYWSEQGATSFKAYMHVTRDELRAATDEAHRLGHKITGHLCSVTYREAATIGIDNLEHGFVAASDFVNAKQPDTCPSGNAVQQSLINLDVNGAAVQSLFAHLIAEGVAITSTLTVFETFTPNRAPIMAGALEAMTPEAQVQYLRRRAQIAEADEAPWSRLFPKAMALELAFVRAGGLLVAGTDPTGYGGVVAGYSNQRQIELLVEAGFSPEEAIQIGTYNGAVYLNRAAEIGSIEVGKVADLIVVEGDVAARIEAIRNVRYVFKDGVGYDPERLQADARGHVGRN